MAKPIKDQLPFRGASQELAAADVSPLGDLDAALDDLKSVIKQDPKGKLARTIAFVEIATQHALNKGDIEGLKKIYSTAFEILPNYFRYIPEYRAEDMFSSVGPIPEHSLLGLLITSAKAADEKMGNRAASNALQDHFMEYMAELLQTEPTVHEKKVGGYNSHMGTMKGFKDLIYSASVLSDAPVIEYGANRDDNHRHVRVLSHSKGGVDVYSHRSQAKGPEFLEYLDVIKLKDDTLHVSVFYSDYIVFTGKIEDFEKVLKENEQKWQLFHSRSQPPAFFRERLEEARVYLGVPKQGALPHPSITLEGKEIK